MPTTHSFSAGLLVVLGSTSAAAQCPAWSAGLGFSGVDGAVNAFVTFDDGAGPGLYVGGAFTHADDVAAGRVARWDGTAWTALGGGLDGEVHALCVFDDGGGPALYVGGFFTQAGGVPAARVARWDGTSWSGVGAGFDNSVRALAVHDDGTGARLYAGGLFTHSGAASVRRLARWNGSAWEQVGGGVEGFVSTLLPRNGALLVGGGFFSAGGLAFPNIARWNGTSWSALDTGLDNVVHALVEFDDGTGSALHAAGEFRFSGATPLERIARWNGTSWSPLGQGAGGPVRGLLARPGDGLYATGDFFTIGGISARGVARWNGSGWDGLGAPFTGGRALASYDDGGGAGPVVHCGGVFPIAFSQPCNRIARLDGAAWRPVGAADGLQASTLQLVTTALAGVEGIDPAVDGLYAGGNLAAAGNVLANRIARYDGTRWTPLGDGLDPNAMPQAIAVFDPGGGPEVYVAGDIATAGGQSVNRIARWDGAQWHDVGGGMNDLVTALHVHDDGTGPALYAGGYFTQAGGIPATRVARWNGTSWQPVGAGIPAPVLDFAVFDDGAGPKLYAGGGSPGVVNVWDGAVWIPIATSFANSSAFEPAIVTALAAHDDGTGPAHYASGIFTVPAARIARWNGTSWSDVGGGLAPFQAAKLVEFDDGTGGGRALYACGYFFSAGGSPASRIAMWDGTTWHALGSGLTDSGRSLAVFRGALWAGGDFGIAGGVPSQYIARWAGCGPISSFCGGDGFDAHVTTDCPCGNSGGPGRGCAWHFGPQGARLEANGTTSPDTLVLIASGMPNSAPSTIFLKGDVLLEGGIVFGDGVRCIDGNLIRLGAKVNVNGAARYPEAGDVPLADRGMTPPGSGLVGYYQTYYRNAAAFCTSATFNVTNGVRVEW